jgi:predicted dehydrogenase
MRVLIAGFGSIGRRHCSNLRQLAPGAEILVLQRHGAGPDAALAGVQVVRSLEEALSLAPDAAIVASPATSHMSDALALARHGVHLLIEKPLSHSLDGVDALIRECQQRSLVLMTAYNLRFYEPLQRLRNALLAGEIGRVISIRAEVGQYLPQWRSGTDYRQGVSGRRELGGGAILELSHEIDYVRWLCGEVVEVYCLSGHLSDLEIDVEDVAIMLLRFASGAIGSVHVDMVQQPMQRGCRVIGTEGTLLWDGVTHRVQLWNSRADAWRDLHPATAVERNTMFAAELQHFLDCARGSGVPEVGPADGRRVLEIALAAKTSSEQSRPVQL